MRTGLPVRLGLLALLSVAAAAQMTARGVVARSLEARGGAAAFAAVRTLSFTGVVEFGAGQSAPLSVWMTTRPVRIRIEVQLPPGKMVEAFDGRSAWQLNPGASAPLLLHGAAAHHVLDQAFAGVDLVASPDAQPTLAGHGTLDGHRYYAVRYALPTGDTFVQYIDASTWLAFREVTPSGTMDVGGYQRFGGLLLPTRFVNAARGGSQGSLTRQHTALDLPIPEALFQPPAMSPATPTKPGKPSP